MRGTPCCGLHRVKATALLTVRRSWAVVDTVPGACRRILLCVSALVMVVFLGALTVLLDDVYELMEETECTDSDGDTVACTAGTSAVLASWQALPPRMLRMCLSLARQAVAWCPCVTAAEAGAFE